MSSIRSLIKEYESFSTWENVKSPYVRELHDKMRDCLKPAFEFLMKVNGLCYKHLSGQSTDISTNAQRERKTDERFQLYYNNYCDNKMEDNSVIEGTYYMFCLGNYGVEMLDSELLVANEMLYKSLLKMRATLEILNKITWNNMIRNSLDN
jgi:hypothetical protein